MSILKGIRVLDCSIAMAGPFAGQRLGDLGADVIKVEPIGGEWQRRTSAGGARGNRINVSFLSLNRNKRSLAVDLKSKEGQQLIHQLAAKSDVFIQNYRPGVAERLSVDYATLSSINPRLVYVSLSGYGSSGPYANRAGQDLVLQGMSGAMLSAGSAKDPPAPAGQYLVDAISAYNAFEGAIAALFHRERTGEGQLVEVNMLDAIVAIQMQEISVFTVAHKPQDRSAEPHAHVYIRAPYGVFETEDDYVVIAFPPLRKFGEVIGEPSFCGLNEETDAWTRRDEIFAKTRERIKTKTTAEWLRLFQQADIWAGPIYSYAQLVNDPQIQHNGTFVEYDHPTEGTVKTPGFPIRFSKTPSAVTRGAPLAGEHTRDVLGELGYSAHQIDEFFEAGIIGETRL